MLAAVSTQKAAGTKAAGTIARAIWPPIWRTLGCMAFLAAALAPAFASDQFTPPTKEELAMTSLPGYPGAEVTLRGQSARIETVTKQQGPNSVRGRCRTSRVQGSFSFVFPFLGTEPGGHLGG